MTDFTHLHVHTTYSFLDGMCAPKALVARAVELGQSAVAVTDHRHMGGVLAVYRAARDAGIRAIIGMEVDTTDHGHLVLLARDDEGYRNLMHLATEQARGSLGSGTLADNCAGLVVTTACVANRVAAACARGRMDDARVALNLLLTTFDARSVHLELQPTAGPHLRANARLQELAESAGLNCVVTNDVHYLRPENHDAQNALMAIRQKRALGEGHQHPAPVYYLRSGAEMASACDTAGIDAKWLATTAEVADACRVDLELGKPDLPPFSESDDDALRMYVGRGMRHRTKQKGVDYDDFDGPYGTRVEYELKVIADMGYSGYFLIVQDFVNWARAHGCAVGPGRGSGAGSLVAYYLGITDLDPIEHKLFFERFLNPERVSMPDFDIDFMQAKRGEVIDYVVQRWGWEHTGQIATYMALNPKSAIKDASRVLGLPFGRVNDLTRDIPQNLKPHTPEEKAMSRFDYALTFAPELVALAARDGEWAQALDIARSINGCYRQTGTHAGGVVIGRLPLIEYTPLTDDGRTQYDMTDAEAVGLVKFDFLGVKTLDVIDAAANNAGVDIRSLTTDDAGVYAMIAGGDTWGLFQVESPGMTTMCRELRPDRFDDIVAAVALYRPGPMESGMLASFIRRKHGQEDVSYPHPSLETVLSDTYGTIVYQEQVMQAAQVLAGYSLGGADLLRRAMGKKKPAEMAKQRATWLAGCGANDIDPELAETIFDAIEKFAGYGFNRSHAAAYALITYQTAWLKLHHPLSFSAALLSIEAGDQEKLARYARAVRGSGIQLLAPDVNLSGADFVVENQAVRWGLGAVTGMGPAQVSSLVAGAPYTDFYDLVERSGLSASGIKSLVNAGACDRFGVSRARLHAALASALARGKSARKSESAGQTSMFDVMGSGAVTYPEAGDWARDETLTREYAALGVYVSDHPMVDIEAIGPSDYTGGPWVTGVVVDVFARRAKASGRMWAKVTIEDENESMTVVVFPDAYEAASGDLVIGRILEFGGYIKVSDSGDRDFVVQTHEVVRR